LIKRGVSAITGGDNKSTPTIYQSTRPARRSGSSVNYSFDSTPQRSSSSQRASSSQRTNTPQRASFQDIRRARRANIQARGGSEAIRNQGPSTPQGPSPSQRRASAAANNIERRDLKDPKLKSRTFKDFHKKATKAKDARDAANNNVTTPTPAASTTNINNTAVPPNSRINVTGDSDIHYYGIGSKDSNPTIDINPPAVPSTQTTTTPAATTTPRSFGSSGKVTPEGLAAYNEVKKGIKK